MRKGKGFCKKLRLRGKQSIPEAVTTKTAEGIEDLEENNTDADAPAKELVLFYEDDGYPYSAEELRASFLSPALASPICLSPLYPTSDDATPPTVSSETSWTCL